MKKILLLSVVALLASFMTYSQQKAVVWSEDFEGDWTVNWHVEAGTWEVGTPATGPGKAYAGSKCAATVLAGNYSANVSARLIRHTTITIPSADQNPRLKFWHWYSFSSGDYGRVQIKVGSGEWETISETYTNTGSGIWTYPSIDLKAYSGATVQIAFQLITDGSSYTVGSGWYVDDISIITGPKVFNNPETWESGLGDWYADKGTWDVGTPTNGPGKAYNGTKCAGTVLSGNYDANVSSRILSPVFSIPSVDQNPRLRFWHWYSFSSGDYGVVQIKTTEGEWQTISETYANTGSGVWTYPSIDLKAYSGTTVQIAFQLTTDGSSYTVGSGWYVDDISIITGPKVFNNPETWESGLGDWHAEKGTWEVGTPTNGPGKAYNGTKCAGTVLSGNYDPNVSSRMLSPVFSIPSADQNPRLRFWHWYSFSSGDYGTVQIKTENGEWLNILEPIYNTSSGIWSPAYIDLSSYANKKAQVAFNLTSDGSSYTVSSGWYIDDISFDNITWVKDEEVQKMNIYPNPFSEKATIQFDDTYLSGYMLTVYNISGAKVMEMKEIRSDKIELEKGNLPAGIYIVELKGDRVYRNKIIIR